MYRAFSATVRVHRALASRNVKPSARRVVSVFDINQPRLPTPFCSVLVSVNFWLYAGPFLKRSADTVRRSRHKTRGKVQGGVASVAQPIASSVPFCPTQWSTGSYQADMTRHSPGSAPRRVLFTRSLTAHEPERWEYKDDRSHVRILSRAVATGFDFGDRSKFGTVQNLKQSFVWQCYCEIITKQNNNARKKREKKKKNQEGRKQKEGAQRTGLRHRVYKRLQYYTRFRYWRTYFARFHSNEVHQPFQSVVRLPSTKPVTTSTNGWETMRSSSFFNSFIYYSIYFVFRNRFWWRVFGECSGYVISSLWTSPD